MTLDLLERPPAGLVVPNRTDDDRGSPPDTVGRTVTALIVGVPFIALAAAVTRFWGTSLHLHDVLLAIALYYFTGYGIAIGCLSACALGLLATGLTGRQLVLDGEIVAFDAAGRPSFGALQPRMHLRDARRVHQLASESPVAFLIFDLLHAEGRSMLALPYVERRAALAELDLQGEHWQCPPAFDGDGAAASAASDAAGLEGVVAKRLVSRYRPGRRSTDWVKVKHERMQEVVVVGWEPGEGRRAGGIGALVLAVPGDEGGLRYAGQVGTGFTADTLAHLARLLRPLERTTSPLPGRLPGKDAAGVRWVTPKLVGEVRFSEWTRDGRLRHPVWRGLRPDKRPGDVQREG